MQPDCFAAQSLLADTERARVLALLRRYGWNATSFQVLERGFQYWFDGDDACVAYVETSGAWVAAGAPISPSERVGEVARRFTELARSRKKRVCFFATEARFVAASGFSSLHVGEQPVWDPFAWDESLRSSRSLREQLRRAAAKGVEVRQLASHDVAEGSPVRAEVEGLIRRWSGSQVMAPMGFLVDVQPFDFAAERRYFIARHEDRLVGFLAVVPVFQRDGWFFEDLIRDPLAPNGTPECLVDAAMRCAKEEGSHYATLGLAPLAGPVSGWLRTARERLAFFYDFHGLRAFKARLRPHAWEPILLAFPPGRSGNVALYDGVAAFARGSFARFAIQSVLRGPAIVVRMLAVLLVAWTALLACAPPHRWFPSVAVQRAWVGFDLLLIVGLFSLSARWRAWLARTLATLVTADAVLTTMEAGWFNVRRGGSAVDLVVVVVACLAPTVAATILWSAYRRRARDGLAVAAAP